MIFKGILVVSILLVFTQCDQRFDGETVIAEIGGEPIYESELLYTLEQMPPKRRELILGDSTEKQDYFKQFLEGRVKAYTAQKLFSNKDSIGTEYAEKMQLGEYYRTEIISKYLWFSPKDVAQFYQAHTELQVKPLSSSIREVVKTMVLDAFDPKQYYDSIIRSGQKAPPFEKIKERVKSYYYQDVVGKYGPQFFENIIKKNEITFPEFKAHGVKEFYEKSAGMYKTTKGYMLLHIEHRDSLFLSQLFPKKVSAEEFSKKAAVVSANKNTAEQGGSIGLVKRFHCMPYGIGMHSDLFSMLDSIGTGLVRNPLREVESGLFHLFYVTQIVEPEQKPFERVAALVASRMSDTDKYRFQDTDVLVLREGKAFVTYRDVQDFLNTKLGYISKGKTMRQLHSFVAEQFLLAETASNEGVNDQLGYLWFSKDRSARKWIALYDTYFPKTLGVGEGELKKFYEDNRSVFGGEYLARKQDVALALKIPDWAYYEEYLSAPNKYTRYLENRKNGLLDSALFYSAKWKLRNFVPLQELKRRYQKYAVKVVSSEYQDMRSFDDKIADVRRLIEKKNFGDARKQLEDLKVDAESSGKLDSVIFVVAELLSARGRYNSAVLQYQLLEALFPQSNLAEKSLFLKAVALYDTRKKDDALEAFKLLKKRYPTSAYVDDAEAMVKDIESGGRTTRELMKH